MREKTLTREEKDLSIKLDVSLNEEQAAEVLGLAVQTLRNWRHLRRGPTYCKYGNRKIVYLKKDLLAYQEKNRIEPEIS